MLLHGLFSFCHFGRYDASWFWVGKVAAYGYEIRSSIPGKDGNLCCPECPQGLWGSFSLAMWCLPSRWKLQEHRSDRAKTIVCVDFECPEIYLGASYTSSWCLGSGQLDLYVGGLAVDGCICLLQWRMSCAVSLSTVRGVTAVEDDTRDYF